MHWMTNIEDWCISRQLWWGHQVPAWYCADCAATVVAREDPTKCTACGSANLARDPDVLDTWFSSALWPFATLGWPEDTAALKAFYPTSVITSPTSRRDPRVLSRGPTRRLSGGSSRGSPAPSRR